MADVKMPNKEKEVEEILEEEVPQEPVSDRIEDLLEDEDDPIVALADVPPETEVWTDGPTAGSMLELMDKHKHVYVTSISFEEHIAWRPLKRSEYAEISSIIEAGAEEKGELELQMLNEELICRTCVLFPDYSNVDFDDLLAGVPTLVSQQILERSGFTAIGLREMI